MPIKVSTFDEKLTKLAVASDLATLKKIGKYFINSTLRL